MTQTARFDGWLVIAAAAIGLACGIAPMVAATFSVSAPLARMTNRMPTAKTRTTICMMPK